MITVTISKISGCAATDCSFNMHRECHAMAITVGDGACAMCDTYTRSGPKGGSPEIIGGVGACREGDCKFNKSFECAAGSIFIGMHDDHAECKTYTKR